MTAIAACRTCGTEPREGARFCDGCGAPAQDGDTLPPLSNGVMHGKAVHDTVSEAACLCVVVFAPTARS